MAHAEPSFGLQLYSVAFELFGDLESGLKRVREAGFTAVELPMLFGKSAAEMRQLLDDAGLECVAVQYFGFDTPSAVPGTWNLSDHAPQIRDDLAVLGARYAVMGLHLLPDMPELWQNPDPFDALRMAARQMTDAEWGATADLLNRCGALFGEAGVGMAYHNHSREFASLGETSGWDLLLARTDPSLVDFELDIGWAAAAGQDVLALMQNARDRLRLLHLKDCGPNVEPGADFAMDPVPIGQGKIDWPAVLRQCRTMNLTALFLENEHIPDMSGFEAATAGLEHLQRVNAAFEHRTT